jgi:hypothetical protein
VRGQKISVQHSSPLVVGDLIVRCRRINTGAVDQHVDPIVFRVYGVSQQTHGLTVGCGNSFEARCTPEFVNRGDPLVPTFLATSAHHNMSTRPSEADAQSATKSTRSANHNRNLAVEAESLL